MSHSRGLRWRIWNKRLDTIPGPKGRFPFVGLGLHLPLDAGTLFYNWALAYGDIFKIRVGWYDWVVINTPEAVREILEKQGVATSSKAPAPMSHGIVTGGKRMPTMPYGPHWRAQRSVVRAITSVPMTATFVPSQEFEAKQLLFDLATNNDDHRSFYQHIRRYAFSIIMTNTFGERVKSWDHEDARNAVKSQEILRQTSRPGAFITDELPILQKLPAWLQPGRARAQGAAKQVLDVKMGLWRRLEKQYEQGKASHCYAREILEKKQAWYSQGLDEEDLAWVAGGLVEAGFETTAIALNSLVLYLAANPRVQTVAQEELARIVGSDRPPLFADLPRLPYVRSCVKEVLRINPMLIPGIKHFTDADVTYKNHVIPKGTVLVANTAFLHFDPSRFQKPFDFMPERFLGYDLYSSEYAAMSDPNARDHFTFSTGRRTCPGARLAENSIGIALAGIIWAFDIQPPTVNGVREPILADASAFFPGPFHIPKPFAAAFVPRSEARLRSIKEQWENASRDGYELRGVQVDIDGMIRD
ncbi:putative O-methylsterigmatocystin oxidoreductase [Nemania sp. FL0916]|nr:putative O-methylsterigmatocystin oxidoreductase [Nemania sp. FL0916]